MGLWAPVPRAQIVLSSKSAPEAPIWGSTTLCGGDNLLSLAGEILHMPWVRVGVTVRAVLVRCSIPEEPHVKQKNRRLFW